MSAAPGGNDTPALPLAHSSCPSPLPQSKQWEKQQKELRDLKAKGNTKAKAEEKAKQHQQQREKGGAKKKKGNDQAAAEEEEQKQQLLEKPKEYVVHFHFPNPAEIPPPILGIHGVCGWLIFLSC